MFLPTPSNIVKMVKKDISYFIDKLIDKLSDDNFVINVFLIIFALILLIAFIAIVVSDIFTEALKIELITQSFLLALGVVIGVILTKKGVKGGN